MADSPPEPVTVQAPQLPALHTQRFPLGRLAKHMGLVLLFNVALAVAITVFGNDSFQHNLLYSLLIGLSIWFLIDVGRFYFYADGWGDPGPMTVLVLVGVLVGYFAGSAAGDLLRGAAPLQGITSRPKTMLGFLLMSLAAGTVITFYFFSREKLASANLEREEAQHQARQAQLTLLQSQLEPHMLFNTLANLRALIATDPARATHMLDRLNDYLRSTLGASRATEHPLSAEFDRLRDYLELMAIRMGPRLRYTLDLPAGLAGVRVPPLILQSLVENAIVHGLEPQVAGGEIHISAHTDPTALVLQVRDTGPGFDAAQTPEGFGITQVRQRLATRYGPHATIELIANYSVFPWAIGTNGIKNGSGIDVPSGTVVTLRMPLTPLPSA